MELLKIENISKSFPGVQALDNVSLSIEKEEVHALVGENGAGKSTLMHIIAGVYSADKGRIILNGKELSFSSEIQAQQEGIGMVFQETSLVDNLNVMENIFAGRQIVNRLGIINKKKMREKSVQFLKRVGLDIDPLTLLSQLTAVDRQMVEIAKAMSLDPELLILDEPTATISEREYETLFTLIKQLKKRGISIIYISHRLQEIHRICDRVSVLKDGVYQGTRKVSTTDLDEIIKMMVGRKVVDVYDDRGFDRNKSPVTLKVNSLSSRSFKNISFEVRKGEIFGISGLIGAGRTELALALFGMDPHMTGEIIVNNERVNLNSPIDSINAGIGYLTEDRKSAGVFLNLNVVQNIFSANIDNISRGGIVNDRSTYDQSSKYIERLRIMTPSLKQKAINLSGGNQQKLLLARWLLKNPDILIFDEPTRGIDVGAKSEIHNLIRSMALEGKTIIVISSELPEILVLCDNIMVMWQGTKTGQLPRMEATEEKLMHLSAGLGLN